MYVFTEILDNEVYVYMDGSLLYKKWLYTGRSVLFNHKPNFTYDNHTLFTITNIGVKNNITGVIKPLLK